MIPVFTRQALAEIDRRCAERYGLPSIVLMENAATGGAGLATREFGLVAGSRVLVVCGTGNNGGDGLAAARHLSNARVQVEVIMAGPEGRLTPDAATNYRVVRNMRLPVREGGGATLCRAVAGWSGDLVVDALVGTGITTPVRSPLSEFIEAVNARARAGTPVLALDLPSGLDCDSGKPLGIAVRATVTVALVGIKKGFLNPGSTVYTGKVLVAGIGAPQDLVTSLAEDGEH